MSTATAHTPGQPGADEADTAFTRLVFRIVSTVQDWADARKDRVAVCFLNYTLDGFELTVLGRSAAYDFDLNRELADLSTALVRQGVPVTGLLFPASASPPLVGAKPIRIVPA